MKTVLVTGCSSGYGHEIARHFHARGWSVIATMRKPQAAAFPASDRLRVLPLDVTQPDSIQRVIEIAGPIDVLVNNAGIGLAGAFEVTPVQVVREVFETNTFGVMAMTQAVIPQFRMRRSGLIVNVTSSATLAPMPLVAVYTASKTAITGFSESLAHELAEFNVRVKLVQPGYGPGTRFIENGGPRMQGLIPEAYADYAQRTFATLMNPSAVTQASDVAEVIWQAVSDDTARMHYAAGPDAVALARECTDCRKLDFLR